MKSVLFPNCFFSIFVLYTVLMAKLSCINQKSCLINSVLSLPNSVLHYFLKIILMVPF